jgi:hypothetical protein
MADAASGRVWSRRLAGLLGGVGLVVLALSLLMLYVGRILLSDDAFADRVNASLEDPRVGEFVALRITDAVIAQQPDLTAFRPILVVVTRGIVTSAPFRAVLRPAVARVHQAVLSSTAENILLAIPDAGVLIQEALKTVGPAAADKVPARLQPVLEIDRAAPTVRAVARALGSLDSVRSFGRLALLGSLLCLILAVLVSPVRRATALTLGVGVATVGVLLALLVPAGRLLTWAAIPDAGAAGAANGLWFAFFSPLRVAGLIVAIVGAALALIAVPGEGLDPAVLRSQLWGWMSRRRERPMAEIGRLLAIGLAGLVGVVFPGVALTITAIGGGALLLLLSLVGWRRFAQPLLPDELRHAREQVQPWPVALAGIRIVGLMALGVVATAVVLRIQAPAIAEVVVASGGACNGSVELCARPLNKVVFPGAHNAMGSALNPAWLFPNQDLDIPLLLDRGVRAFLIDPYRGNVMGDKVRTDFDATPSAKLKTANVIGNEAWAAGMRIREQFTGELGASGVYLCHGYCELGAIPIVPVLRTFAEFLRTHPNEVVLIDFEDYVVPADIVAAFEESGLIEFVYRGRLGPTWPTLGEMVASGGRLVVLGEYDVGDVPWYHLAWEGLVAETPYTFHTIEEFSCKANRGTPNGGLFLINHWIETTPTPKPSNAQIVNQRDVIVKRVRQCQRERRMTANILAVDFAGIGDVVGAARELNGLPPLPGIPSQP